ncbi:aspartate/glutamate racemase family protein [Parasphingorhabdus sp.]|uniref:maleate cis-trans isomerase family protein n=1 Tax=Parasphingorhabdus sp. TaxID=2709688 RepID=UPI0032647DBF
MSDLRIEFRGKMDISGGNIVTDGVDLGNFDFQTDEGVGSRANIALIALEYDQTIEHEFNRLTMEPGIGVYCTRIRSVPDVTPATLRKMENEILSAVEMLPPGVEMDVVAFGCTSAAFIIGEDVVSEKIRQVRPNCAVTDPITAGLEAMKYLGAGKVGLLTPYIPELNEVIRGRFETAGHEVVSMGSFCEADDNIVAKIDLASVRDAIKRIAEARPCDAIFMSCTSLRAIDIINELEDELGIPITTSTHALAWHAMHLGQLTPQNGTGALFRRGAERK